MKILTTCLFTLLLISSCSEDNIPINTSSPSESIPQTDNSQDTALIKTSIDISNFGKLEYNSVAYENLGLELIQLESLGGIHIGQEQNEVIMTLGKPDSTSALVLWDIDGGEHISWYYPELGLTIELMNMKGEKASFVQVIELENQNSVTTSKEVTIGTDFKTVIEKYSRELMFVESFITGENISIGNGGYCALQFEITNNQVSYIYLGPTIRC